MSIIHVRQIERKIRELFYEKINISDLSAEDSEKEIKILTRCLAAYAVYLITDCNVDEAANAVTDGADDNGIDAVYYSPAMKQLILVQSKWIQSGTNEPRSEDIAKFCQGVKDLFNLSFDRFNHKFHSKQTMIEHAISEYDTKYFLVLIHTGDKGLAIHSQRRIDDLLEELNDAGEGITEPLVSFTIFNQGKIHASLASSIGTQQIDLEIGLKQWGKITEPHPAFFGMVAGEEIAQWWVQYGRRLFDKNIRQVLGSTDVNEEIKSTLTSSPEKFWYFNNGITIVADKIEKSMIGGSGREQGTFKLINAQIVNGAQTVSTIGKFYEKKGTGLENVSVHARIISLEGAPEEFGIQVTKTNNRQNRIENRDYVAQDPEQLRLKAELAIDGIDYNIVRSDTFKPSEKSFDLLEATAALACATGEASYAVQAKREIGKFYEDLTKGLYKRLFNPSVTGLYVYNVVQIVRKTEELLREEIDRLPKKSGRRYGMLVHGNRIIELLVFIDLQLNTKAKEPTFNLDEINIRDSTDKIIERLAYVLDKKFKDSLLGTLFKNTTKCREIVELCLSLNNDEIKLEQDKNMIKT